MLSFLLRRLKKDVNFKLPDKVQKVVKVRMSVLADAIVWANEEVGMQMGMTNMGMYYVTYGRIFLTACPIYKKTGRVKGRGHVRGVKHDYRLAIYVLRLCNFARSANARVRWSTWLRLHQRP